MPQEIPMGTIIDIIRSILGLGPKDEYGGLTPGDLEAYWCASNDIDQAERDGDISVGLRKHGMKSEDHWERVQSTFARLHGDSPEFSLAAATANFKQQMAELATPDADGSAYRMPSEYLEPVEGISLDRLALAKVRTEVQGPAALTPMGLDASKLQRIESAWTARMGGSADPTAASILSSLYSAYVQQIRAALTR
jgi:hypothetical protein